MVRNYLFWKRNQTDYQYLYFVEEYFEEGEDQEWEGRVRKLHNDIKSVKTKADQVFKRTEGIPEISKKLDQLLSRLENTKP